MPNETLISLENLQAYDVKIKELISESAGGGKEMELTWAEYNALSEEEKNNGTTYYIKDKSAAGAASELSELTDVELDNVTNGQALVYDAVGEKWVNGDVTSGGVITTNLLKITANSQTINGITITVENGIFTINGTSSATIDIVIGYAHSALNTKLKFFGKIAGEAYTNRLIQSDGVVYNEYGNGIEITSNGAIYTAHLVIASGKTLTNSVFKPIITTNLSATYSDFVPYSGDTGVLQSDVAQVADDVMNLKMLGWTVPSEMPVKNYVDENGQFVQRVGRVDLSELNTYYNSAYELFFCAIPDIKDGSVGFSTKYTHVFGTPNTIPDKSTNANWSWMSATHRVFVKDSAYTDVSEFKAAVKGIYFYYELITEKTYPIDGNEIATDTLNLKMLGYTVPHEMPIQNYVDNNGVFHQRVDRVDLGNFNWNLHSSIQGWFYAFFNTKSKNCYCIKYTKYDGEAGNIPDKYILTDYSNNRIIIRDTSYTDTTTFKNSLSGVYLYYELTTEITKNVDGHEHEWELIGSVKGTNNIAIDCTKYKEFWVAQCSPNTSPYTVVHLIPSCFLTQNGYNMRGGDYRNSSDYIHGSVFANISQIANSAFALNGSSIVANSTMTVYGRR